MPVGEAIEKKKKKDKIIIITIVIIIIRKKCLKNTVSESEGLRLCIS